MKALALTIGVAGGLLVRGATTSATDFGEVSDAGATASVAEIEGIASALSDDWRRAIGPRAHGEAHTHHRRIASRGPCSESDSWESWGGCAALETGKVGLELGVDYLTGNAVGGAIHAAQGIFTGVRALADVAFDGTVCRDCSADDPKEEVNFGAALAHGEAHTHRPRIAPQARARMGRLGLGGR